MSHLESKHEQHPHILPISVYVKTLIALFVLMAITVVAGQVSLPGGTVVNNIVAITIAVTKASLVIMFFMGVKFGTRLTKFWALIGFMWFGLMFITMGDYGARSYEPAPSFDKQDPGSAMSRSIREPLGTENPNMINVRPR